MDFKNMLAALDKVENAEGTSESSIARKGSMKALLESLDSVVADEVVAEETVEATEEELEEATEATEETEETEEVVEADDEDLEAAEEELEEAIMVSAEGDEAAELLAILKNSGLPEPAMPAMPAMPEPEMEDTEYANSPDEETFGMDAVIASGDDLNKSKEAYSDVDGGDNPMETFEGKFKAMLDEMLAEDEETTEEVVAEEETAEEVVAEETAEVVEADDLGLSRFLKMAGV